MKRYCLYLALLLALVALNGCIKDDNPYPEIQNTSWKTTKGERWERVSFSAGRVHHVRFIPASSDTLEYYADYTKGVENGRHFFSWISQDGSLKYRVFSLGHDNVVIDNIPYGEGPWIIGLSEVYYRDEDPVEGYNY